jgi:hypothetical protein
LGWVGVGKGACDGEGCGRKGTGIEEGWRDRGGCGEQVWERVRARVDVWSETGRADLHRGRGAKKGKRARDIESKCRLTHSSCHLHLFSHTSSAHAGAAHVTIKT